ncbi:MAG: hypothetical protein GY793_06965 [Proteobacteria bacterium]|nr:hypothetical protein [Pseudomonadota bacterium]
MYKKLLLLTFSLIFAQTLAKKSFAVVEFKLNDNPYFESVAIDGSYSFLNAKDFNLLYNSDNEVIYIKHKSLPNTYKLPLISLENGTNSIRINKGKEELLLLGYKNNQTSVSSKRGLCLEVHGSKDLYESFNSGASSMLPLYKAFVYMTGQLQMDKQCRNLILSKSLDKPIGFPMAIFYKDKIIKLTKMTNITGSKNSYKKNLGFDTKLAKKTDLELQYELMFSMLNKEQKKLFLAKFGSLSNFYKVRAINNLLSVH